MITDHEIDLLVETGGHLLEVEKILAEIIEVDHGIILGKIIDRTITGEITD